jgi:hypothetical protein
MKMLKRISGIIVSLLALVTLMIDYYFIDDFHLDDGIFYGLSILLFANIARKLVIPTSMPLTVIMNLAITGVALYCFRFVLLIGWGNSFTGRGLSFIWVMGFALNFVLPMEAVIETVKKIRSRNHGQS